MQQLIEILPIIIFFSVYYMRDSSVEFAGFEYQFDGIYSATAALMIATCIQMILVFLIAKRLEKRQIFLFVTVMVAGGLTLLLQNKMFIQWKPTVFNWVLALVFLASQFVGDKNLLQRFLGQQLVLPKAVWGRLNLLYVAHFSVVGALNLFVAYRYEEAFWVSYKLYSSLGFTIALMALTVLLLFPHLKNQIPNSDTEDPMRGEL